MYEFTRKERAHLELQREGRLAVVGSRGAPYVCPMCHIFNKGVVYLPGLGSSWKVANASKNANVAYVVDEYTENWENLRGIRMQGTMEVLPSGDEYSAAKRLLLRKYPQFRGGFKNPAKVLKFDQM